MAAPLRTVEATDAVRSKEHASPLLHSERLVSVDLLRGVVMVVMALDHTRDYFSYLRFAPEDLSHTYAWLFFTRWITHFCAPLFFFLAGTGAFLSASRGKTRPQITRFLWTRGLWLVFLELTVVAFGWTFRPSLGPLGLVIWALGWSMVAMSLLVRLPVRWIAAFGVAMICLHNLADRLNSPQFGKMAWLWTALHSPGAIWIKPPTIGFFVLYALIPWIGVMAVGYAFGAVLLETPERRRKLTWRIGLVMTLAFLFLRATNLYGNPPAGWGLLTPYSSGGWQIQKTATLSIISFLNVQKYPPSLQFLLMTLGPALMFLAWLDRRVNVRRQLSAAARFFLVFGRVPMFYYILHIYLIHSLAVIVALTFHQPAKWLFQGAFMLGQLPDGYGHGLPFIYLVWMTAVVGLYPLCTWFMRVKQRRKDWWLSYI